MLLLEIVVAAGQLLVGVAFLSAGLAKLRDVDGAQIAILDYQLVSARFSKPMAMLLGLSEAVIGGALTLGCVVAAPAGLVLLMIFTAAAASALIRGLDIDCHCFNSSERLSTFTLLRNGIFAIVLSATLLLGPRWSDSVIVPQLAKAPLAYSLAVGIVAIMMIMIVTLMQVFVGTTTKRVRIT